MTSNPSAQTQSEDQEFRKTATVKARQWWKMGDHPGVILKSDPSRYADEGIPWCPTLEGGHVVTPGDWIATGVQGEHWPIKPDVFSKTYAPAHAGELDDPTGARKIELWDHMSAVAKANGHDSITDAITKASKWDSQSNGMEPCGDCPAWPTNMKRCALCPRSAKGTLIAEARRASLSISKFSYGELRGLISRLAEALTPLKGD